MIVVFMEATDSEGRVVNLRDYLVSTPRAIFKIEQFCSVPSFYGAKKVPYVLFRTASEQQT